MNTSIKKWGNSQGIRIPKSLLDLLHWKTDEPVELIIKNNKIIIQRIQRKTIEQLFDDYKDDYISEEIDWGEAVGEEVW